MHRSEAELRTTCDTRGLKQYDLQEITKVTSNDEIEKGTTVSVQKVQYKTVQHRTVRKKFKLNKKTVRYKTDGKTVRSNNCFNKPVGQKVFNKHERQNSDCRSRAHVLRACQQRVRTLYEDYSRLSPQSGDALVARQPEILNWAVILFIT